MRTSRLGANGPLVSSVGLGGNIFGHFCNEAETLRIMNAAFDAGVNYVDTADVYSNGLSEKLIGRAIGQRRSEWFIATKIGVAETASAHRGLGRREVVLSRIDESLKRLGTDYVDLYQTHHYDPDTPLEETLGALEEVVKLGKARWTGVCNYTGDELLGASGINAGEGLRPLASVQNLYHLLKPEVEASVLPACREIGMSFVAYGVLARGVLTGKYGSDGTPPPGSRGDSSKSVRADLQEHVLGVVNRLGKLAREADQTVSRLAVAWVLRRPEVAVALVGVRNEAQLNDIVGASDWTLSTTEVDAIEEAVGDRHKFDDVALGPWFRPK